VVTSVLSATGKIYLPTETQLVAPVCDNELEVNPTISTSHAVNVEGKLIDGLGHRYPHIDWIWLEQNKTSLLATTIPASAQKNLSWQNGLRNAPEYKLENVLPGSYTLHSIRFDEISDRAETIIPIDVYDSDLNVDIVSDSPYQIHGSIRFDARSFPLLGKNPFRIIVYPIAPAKAASMSVAKVARDGIFTVSALPEGRFRLAFENLPEPFYIKAARQGAVDVLKEGIKVSGKLSAPLVVVVGSDGGDINGSVRTVDGTNRLATIVLIPHRTGVLRSNLYKVVQADENSQFRMHGVAPGNYELYAWPPETISRRDYFDPEFIRHFQGQVTPVQIGSAGAVTVTLQLLSRPNQPLLQ
jgi:hypothetical protein